MLKVQGCGYWQRIRFNDACQVWVGSTVKQLLPCLLTCTHPHADRQTCISKHIMNRAHTQAARGVTKATPTTAATLRQQQHQHQRNKNNNNRMKSLSIHASAPAHTHMDVWTHTWTHILSRSLLLTPPSSVCTPPPPHIKPDYHTLPSLRTYLSLLLQP